MEKNNCLMVGMFLLVLVSSASSSAAEAEKRKIYISDGQVQVYELTKNFPAPKGLSYDNAEQIKNSIEIIGGLMDGVQEKPIMETHYGEMLSFFPMPIVSEKTTITNLAWRNDKLEESIVIKTSSKKNYLYFFIFFFLYPGVFSFMLFNRTFVNGRKYKIPFLVILFLIMPWLNCLATEYQVNPGIVAIIFSFVFSFMILKPLEASALFILLLITFAFFSSSLHNFFLSYFLFLLAFSVAAACAYYYLNKKQYPPTAEQES